MHTSNASQSVWTVTRTLADAAEPIAFIAAFDESKPDAPFARYEVGVRYSDGDEIRGQFNWPLKRHVLSQPSVHPPVPIRPQQRPDVHNRYRCSPGAGIGFDPMSPIDEPIAVHEYRVEIADDRQPFLEFLDSQIGNLARSDLFAYRGERSFGDRKLDRFNDIGQ